MTPNRVLRHRRIYRHAEALSRGSGLLPTAAITHISLQLSLLYLPGGTHLFGGLPLAWPV